MKETVSKEVYRCDRCNKKVDPLGRGGTCIQCEHYLCPRCAEWVGDICKACSRMIGIKDGEECELYYYPEDVIRQIEDRCRSLEKMASQGIFHTRKSFKDEIAEDRWKEFYPLWRSMQKDPKEWVNEQLTRLRKEPV